MVNTLGLLQWLLAYYIFSFSGLRPQTPTRALPLDPAGRLLSPVPVLSPSETNFWLRPCFHRNWTVASRSACYAHEGIRAGRRASCHGAKRRGSLFIHKDYTIHKYVFRGSILLRFHSKRITVIKSNTAGLFRSSAITFRSLYITCFYNNKKHTHYINLLKHYYWRQHLLTYLLLCSI